MDGVYSPAFGRLDAANVPSIHFDRLLTKHCTRNMASAAKNVSNLLRNSRQHTINHHFLKEVGEKQRHSVLSAMNHCHPRKSLDNNLGGLLEVKCTVEGDQLHRLLAFFAVGIGSIVNLLDHWSKLQQGTEHPS